MTRDDRTLMRTGRLFSGITVVVALICMATVAVVQWDFLLGAFAVHNGIIAVGFGSLAWVALRTQPRNLDVWVLAWAAFFGALFTAGVAIAVLWGQANIPGFSLELGETLTPADLPVAAALAIQPMLWAYIPAFFLVLTLGLLLFPDGRPPSPRWRWVGWYSVVTIALAVLPWMWLNRPSSSLPLGAADVPESGAAGELAGVLMVLVMLGAVLSVAALVVRYWRSSGVTRRQIRWIAWGGSFVVATLVVSSIVEGVTAESGPISSALIIAGESMLILSFAFAITKYRLYDIDLVISKTVTYGALAIFITAVYVAIVVGVGALIGQGDEPNLALAIAATALVALLFEPIRSRVQRWANRLVYGERATPYAVLSELTARFSEAASNEQALERLAALLGSGTGADEATVWLRVGDELRPEAFTSHEAPESVRLTDRALLGLHGDAAEPIEHGGELLGALSIRKSKADPVTPADRQLLGDVAAGAGLLLRNIQLNAELEDRADELRSSRRRLIAAQDLERRKLERNLHDGAQQQVVAIKVKLGLARTLAEREELDEVANAVGELSNDTQRAVDGMRAAARGIYPPLLEAEGLHAALSAAGREASIRVDIAADGIGRYPPEIEATVYFAVLEAVGDALDESSREARVSLGDDGEALSFSVYDATVGSSPGFGAAADRLDALGGTLHIETTPSGETVVTGRLPAKALEPA